MISDIRIRLTDDMLPRTPDGTSVVAFASVLVHVTLPQGVMHLVVKEIRILQDRRGKLFLGMPSRPCTRACPRCGRRVASLSRFCGQCGIALEAPRADEISPQTARAVRGGRDDHYYDVVFPLDGTTRYLLADLLFSAYREEERRVLGAGSETEGGGAASGAGHGGGPQEASSSGADGGGEGDPPECGRSLSGVSGSLGG